MTRIGIMGGTFDPVHYGHLVSAEAAYDAFGLDTVIFVPAARPPHKDPQQVSDVSHRYRMLELATADNPHFEVSAVEMRRPGPSYTVDTLEEFRRRYGDEGELYFISGGDAITEVDTWHRPERLFELAEFIGTTRPGYRRNQLETYAATRPAPVRERLHILSIPHLDISSSDLRNRFGSGQPVRYLLPAAVAAYVRRHGLYGASPASEGATSAREATESG